MILYSENEKLLRNLTFIDLFCGIGGFHLALTSLGAKCVFASDINVNACKVYEQNFGITPKGDITKIKSSEIPHHDILCAGFPCQPFSISGTKMGFSDNNGKLFFEIVRIARFHRPKILFLENVKNLLSHDKGKTILTIVNSLKRIGYTVFYKVINSADFGVPQARKRIYIIAFRNDLCVDDFTFPKGVNDFKCLEDILVENVSNKYIVNREYTLNKNALSTDRKKELIRIGSIGKGRQGERVYSIKGQAITLSSQGGGLGGKTGIYVINDSIRILCPRECARLMGFPDNFILSLRDSESYRQMGNSVVVDVIQEIAKCAATKLLKGNQNG